MLEYKLDGVCVVRWIAALFVMTGHMYCLLLYNPPIVLWNLVHRLGIISFFVIGGYLVTGSWAREQRWRDYMLKRIVRIFPPLIFFVIIVACILGPLLSNLSVSEYFSNKLFYKYLTNNILFINYTLPGVFQENPYPNVINGSIWSLPIEFFMYFIIPFFYKIGKQNYRINIFIVLLICILSIIKRLFYPSFYFVIYGVDIGSMIEVVPFYFIGMLIYVLHENNKIKLYFNNSLIYVIFALSIIWTGITQLGVLIISFIAIPYVIFGIATIKKNKISTFLSKYEITYGIFLYGFFIQQCVIYFNNKYNYQFPFLILFLISIVLTIIVSMCSYFYVEKPIIEWSKKFINKNKLMYKLEK